MYDGLGRQTTIPAADAPAAAGGVKAGAGAITVKYFADDAAAAITRNGTTSTIARDPAGRRLTVTSSGTAAAGTETKHYADDSDNPAWTTRKQGTETITTRYESTIGGDLALTITGNTVELAVNNPHGDVVATVPLTGTGAGQGITGWAQYDEYGNQLTEPVNTGATTYGWHGADERAVDTSGLILMGARLYNSVTGLFTSRDPVEGGNTTSYAYPQDPVGTNDLSGLFQWGKWLDRASTGLAVAGMFGCALCAAGSAAIGLGRGIYKIRNGKKGEGWVDIAGSVTFGVGKGLRAAGKLWKKSQMKKYPKGHRVNKYKRKKIARKYRKYNNRVVKRYDRFDRIWSTGTASYSSYGMYTDYRAYKKSKQRR